MFSTISNRQQIIMNSFQRMKNAFQITYQRGVKQVIKTWIKFGMWQSLIPF